MNQLPYLLPWVRVALLIRSIRMTTFDEATWATAKMVLAWGPHDAERAHTGGLVELRSLALCGHAGTSELLAYGMKGIPGRVLIVDDEPLVRGLLHDLLTTEGDEVAIAASGADALKVVPVFQPDVIVTDMLMPGMSGPDLLDALRRAGVTVPVILISGQPITPEGFFGLLEKPSTYKS